MNEESNPFLELSNLFVENQRQFNVKSNELISRLDVLNIEQESSLILSVAKELEFQRDQINNSLELLKETKKIKLNK
jgi:hypothetical protein